jgi:general secretion pathway protein G
VERDLPMKPRGGTPRVAEGLLRHCRCDRRRNGLTVLELLIALAIVSTLAAIAIPKFLGYAERAERQQAILDIRAMESPIDRFIDEFQGPPSNLGQALDPVPKDPWGNDYRYLNLMSGDPGISGQRRRDKNLNPVNSDYDLYSMGPDGETAAQFASPQAQDDIVRAADGAFIGVADDF